MKVTADIVDSAEEAKAPTGHGAPFEQERRGRGKRKGAVRTHRIVVCVGDKDTARQEDGG